MQNCAIRRLTPVDLEAAHQLSTTTGWNQTLADWKRLLTLQPDGCYAAFCDDQLVGTVTTTEYGQAFGWIGMVLVNPAHRGGGIGKQLLQTGIDSLRSHGVATIKLDATPQGEPIYAKAGFRPEYALERWEGTANPSATASLPTTSQSTTSQTADSAATLDNALIEEIFAFDAQHFGADRSRLLHALLTEFPHFCLIEHDGDRLFGYIMGRPGRRANYLGPWLATETETAQRLFNALLALWPNEPFLVDINTTTAARTFVQEYGMQLQRPLLRMYEGPNDSPGHPGTVFGIAGPEIG